MFFIFDIREQSANIKWKLILMCDIYFHIYYTEFILFLQIFSIDKLRHCFCDKSKKDTKVGAFLTIGKKKNDDTISLWIILYFTGFFNICLCECKFNLNREKPQNFPGFFLYVEYIFIFTYIVSLY